MSRQHVPGSRPHVATSGPHAPGSRLHVAMSRPHVATSRPHVPPLPTACPPAGIPNVPPGHGDMTSGDGDMRAGHGDMGRIGNPARGSPQVRRVPRARIPGTPGRGSGESTVDSRLSTVAVTSEPELRTFAGAIEHYRHDFGL